MNNNPGYETVIKKPRVNGRFAPKDKIPMKTLGVRLPLDVFEWIEEESQRLGISKTDLARKLIVQQKTN